MNVMGATMTKNAQIAMMRNGRSYVRRILKLDIGRRVMVSMEEIKFGRRLMQDIVEEESLNRGICRIFGVDKECWTHLQWLERRMHYDITMSREFK